MVRHGLVGIKLRRVKYKRSSVYLVIQNTDYFSGSLENIMGICC